jgi:hypothetical protein
VANVTHAAECPVEEAVHQVDGTVQQVDETRHTDEGVDFVTFLVVAKDLDFEIAVDFAY